MRRLFGIFTIVLALGATSMTFDRSADFLKKKKKEKTSCCQKENGKAKEACSKEAVKCYKNK